MSTLLTPDDQAAIRRRVALKKMQQESRLLRHDLRESFAAIAKVAAQAAEDGELGGSKPGHLSGRTAEEDRDTASEQLSHGRQCILSQLEHLDTESVRMDDEELADEYRAFRERLVALAERKYPDLELPEAPGGSKSMLKLHG